ncbi:hypothetical protein AVEN_206616-1 [Araneus ventricosus]|uniref:Uncharacterized protein n=1 Tax=Araneus ventricosus TaxID=182803 RepID=A0A4Y2QWE8_ARAVE|nr:hypothetical protein AVEN_23518-1 [Araneus ventricosus]GBN68052.1 hypothetical protein AVEN_206616-1 [Araneus ventricosus]
MRRQSQQILSIKVHFLYRHDANFAQNLSLCELVVVVSYSTCCSPQLDQVQESARPQKINTIDERFMVKEESAASVGTDLGRPREEV